MITGYAAGGHYNIGGGGSNFLCLPEDPQWKNYRDGAQGSGAIAGVEYQTHYNPFLLRYSSVVVNRQAIVGG